MNKYAISTWEGPNKIEERALFSYGFIKDDEIYKDIKILIKPKCIIVDGDTWDWKEEHDCIGFVDFVVQETDIQFKAADDDSARLMFEVT